MILYDCIGVICVKKHHFKKKKPIPTEPQWKISSRHKPISFSSSDWMIFVDPPRNKGSLRSSRDPLLIERTLVTIDR